MNDDEAVGNALRRIRVEVGLAQDYLHDELTRMGVSIPRTSIGKIENGTRALTYVEAVALAHVLRCDVGAFAGGTPGAMRLAKLAALQAERSRLDQEIQALTGAGEAEKTARPEPPLSWLNADSPIKWR